jgi:RNA polymerase sigma factor (sigma-70 family)
MDRYHRTARPSSEHEEVTNPHMARIDPGGDSALLPLTDEDVMLRSRDDPDVFRLLVQRYGKKVYNFLLRLTRDPTVAEDLLQETLLKAFEGRVQYRARGAFSSWLFTIARNLSADRSRSRSRRNVISLDARALRAGPPQAAAGLCLRGAVRGYSDAGRPVGGVAGDPRPLARVARPLSGRFGGAALPRPEHHPELQAERRALASGPFAQRLDQPPDRCLAAPGPPRCSGAGP